MTLTFNATESFAPARMHAPEPAQAVRHGGLVQLGRHHMHIRLQDLKDKIDKGYSIQMAADGMPLTTFDLEQVQRSSPAVHV